MHAEEWKNMHVGIMTHARVTLDFIVNTLTIHKKIIGPISAAQGEQHP